MMRAILRRAAILVGGGVLIATGMAVLRAAGGRPGLAAFSLVLIGTGVLFGLGAQLSTPAPARSGERAGHHPQDR